MAIRKYKPTTPGRRASSVSEFDEITRSTPEKSLLRPLSKTGGRNNYGRITTRHIGGGHKRRYRLIDFRRNDKDGIPAKVAHIEYDPNRTARIALLHYADGEKRYIIAPERLAQGATVEAGPKADIKPGNNLPLRNIPTGTVIHAIELRPGGGANLDTVLRQTFQTDQAVLDQRRYAVGQQPIQHRLMVGAEVRESMVVHAHAAAQPAIDEVALAQAHDLAGAADTIDHRIQPQRQQQTRIDRRPPHRVRARLDRGVKLTQFQRRHEAPHQTSRMIEGDQGIEINDLPGRLVTPGLLHPRRPGAGRQLRRRLLRKLLEQTRSRALGQRAAVHRRLPISRTGASNQIHSETATGKNSQPLSSPDGHPSSRKYGGHIFQVVNDGTEPVVPG